MEALKWLNMARIDIKNQGEGNDVNVTVKNGADCNITKPGWFSKGGIGCVLETADKHLVLEVKCNGGGELLFSLKGLDRCFPEGKRLPLWVDYTRFSINKEIIFWELKPLWHDRPYKYFREVEDGEILNVEISWSNHGFKGEELSRLLSMWRCQ